MADDVMRSADRERTVKLIRTALRLRSGKAWSVSIGRGTARGWITITAPPARHWNGHMSLDDRAELGRLLYGESGEPVHAQGESVPASSEYRRVYIQRALYGTANGFTASPYWD
jgi:hypothetical protein